MKKIMLAAALIAVTFTAALAANNSKAENDADMKAGRKALISKTSELEADIKNHKEDAAEAATMDVLALMRHGVAQTRYDAGYMKGAPAKAQMDHMLSMENIVFDYMKLMKDVPTNGPQLVKIAKSFSATY